MKRGKHPTLRSAYDEILDAGSVVIAGEQAKALVFAVADALRSDKYDDITKARMVAAVEAINHTFRLGIEKQ